MIDYTITLTIVYNTAIVRCLLNKLKLMLAEIKQIHSYLKQAKKILITPHQNPDGDALGSATALAECLYILGKPISIFCATGFAEKWEYLAHINEITNDPLVFADPDIDTIVVVDSGDLRYAGVANFIDRSRVKLINIDHHATNERYGDINLVIPTASATAEVLYHFFQMSGLTINPTMATSLLTGLITDTDNFLNAATSAEVMAIASDLFRHGGNIKTINKRLLKNKSVDSLKLWGEVLKRLKKIDELDISYTYITQADILRSGIDEGESEGIANFLNGLNETKISLILKETKDGRVKGSFRTTHHDVDVSALAKAMGGGGHKKAAGFNAPGTIKEVLEKIKTLSTEKN